MVFFFIIPQYAALPYLSTTFLSLSFAGGFVACGLLGYEDGLLRCIFRLAAYQQSGNLPSMAKLPLFMLLPPSNAPSYVPLARFSSSDKPNLPMSTPYISSWVITRRGDLPKCFLTILDFGGPIQLLPGLPLRVISPSVTAPNITRFG